MSCCCAHARPRQGPSTPSYVFFQGGQLLIQSLLVCPERKWPLLSVRRDSRGLPGPRRLCYQLLRGIDDFQDFCGDVAERNSRILLFGPMTEGDRRQEQHINNDVEILRYHSAHRAIASITTHPDTDVPKEREGNPHSRRGLRGGLAGLGLASGPTLTDLRFLGRTAQGESSPCPLPTAESFIPITSLSG